MSGRSTWPCSRPSSIPRPSSSKLGSVLRALTASSVSSKRRSSRAVKPRATSAAVRWPSIREADTTSTPCRSSIASTAAPTTNEDHPKRLNRFARKHLALRLLDEALHDVRHEVAARQQAINQRSGFCRVRHRLALPRDQAIRRARRSLRRPWSPLLRGPDQGGVSGSRPCHWQTHARRPTRVSPCARLGRVPTLFPRGGHRGSRPYRQHRRGADERVLAGPPRRVEHPRSPGVAPPDAVNASRTAPTAASAARCSILVAGWPLRRPGAEPAQIVRATTPLHVRLCDALAGQLFELQPHQLRHNEFQRREPRALQQSLPRSRRPGELLAQNVRVTHDREHYAPAAGRTRGRLVSLNGLWALPSANRRSIAVAPERSREARDP